MTSSFKLVRWLLFQNLFAVIEDVPFYGHNMFS